MNVSCGHSLIATGGDPIPLHIVHSTVIQQDVRTTEEEADTILIQQKSIFVASIVK